MQQLPLVFLAFAQISTSHLAQLGQEADAIYDALLPLQDQRRLEIRPRMSADLKLISNLIDELRDRVYIFHYAGHAGEKALHLTDGINKASSVARLFQFLPNIHLVFLNGCATKAQVEELWNNGVPVVIASSVPINDIRAKKLGGEFYSALAGGMSIGDAFKKAAITLDATNDFPNDYDSYRNLISDDVTNDGSELEWGIYVRQGQEAALNWKISDLPKPAIEEELEIPPQETPPLYQRLEHLNYRKHIPLLRKYLLRHDYGAFLIHGPPKYGQTWLANNRLTAFREMTGLDLPRSIQLGPRIAKLEELVEEIKKVMRFGRGFESVDAETASLSLKLFERLKSGPVLIRIHDVQAFIRNGFFENFLKEFWQPMIEQIEAHKKAASGQLVHKLVLLLIEEDEPLDADLPVLMKEVPDIPQYQKILFLPEIPAVNVSEFSRWLEFDYQAEESLFLDRFSDWDEAQLKAWLGDEGKLPPETFMEKICDSFDYYFDVNGQGQWELVP